MVELFMRRRAALSASLLDLPPVREGLQYFWSGLDLPDPLPSSGPLIWNSRTGEGSITWTVPTTNGGTVFPNHTIMIPTSYANRIGTFSPSSWIGSVGMISEYTVEVVADLDWSKSSGGKIIGSSTTSDEHFHIGADPANGMYAILVKETLSSGPISEGLHCLSVTLSLSNMYDYRIYLDGDLIQSKSSILDCFKAPDAPTKVPLGGCGKVFQSLNPGRNRPELPVL